MRIVVQFGFAFLQALTALTHLTHLFGDTDLSGMTARLIQRGCHQIIITACDLVHPYSRNRSEVE